MSYDVENLTLYDPDNSQPFDYDPQELRTGHQLTANETSGGSQKWNLALDDKPELSLRGDLRVPGDGNQATVNIGESGEYPQNIEFSGGFSVIQAWGSQELRFNEGGWDRSNWNNDFYASSLSTYSSLTFYDAENPSDRTQETVRSQIYEAGNIPITTCTNFSNVATVWSISADYATPGDNAGTSEATLNMWTGDQDGNVEYVDLYNNNYTAPRTYGFSLQKRGSGIWKQWWFGWSDGNTDTRAYAVYSPDQTEGPLFVHDTDVEIADTLSVDQVDSNDNSNLSFNANRLEDVSDPVNAQDAATKGWADNKFSTSNTQDPIDLFVNGTNIDYNVEDLNLIANTGSGIDLNGIDELNSSSGDTEVEFSVDESEINHDSLSGGTDSNAHHTRPSAGSGLTDSSNTFNVNAGNALNINNDDLDVDESAINHNNLTNSNDSDAHHTRPSAGNGLTDNSNTFDVNDPLTLSILNVDKVRPNTNNGFIYFADALSDNTLTRVGRIEEQGGLGISFPDKSSSPVKAVDDSSNPLDFTCKNLIASGSVFGDNIPRTYVRADGSANIQSQGPDISGVTGSSGIYTVSTNLSSITSVQVSVADPTGDTSTDVAWMNHYEISGSDVIIELVRLDYDSNGVIDVGQVAPSGFTVTMNGS